MNYVRIAILPFGAVAVMCIIHAILTRVLRPVRLAPQVIGLGSLLAANAALAGAGIGFGWAQGPWGLIYVLLVYNSAALCYLLVLNVSETSLHVHIIMELLLAGKLAAAELSKRYNAKHMIDARIDRMIALGQLTERNGRYVLRSRSLVVVGGIINMLRRLLSLPLSPG